MGSLVSNSGAATAGKADAAGAGALAKSGWAPASEAGQPFRETLLGWVVLGVVWAAGAAYMAAYLRHGWVPVDAGTLGEMAERVLRGQVPFRDFGEIYTGGLTFLNALALRLFGENLFSLRIPLFLFFLAWLPSVYFIARRFSGPIGAGLVMLLSAAWSVPNYPEAMPSWYNLFFATWGVLALVRYTESERKRWVLAAGLCGGLSVLAKISGLFFVAAGLLFFVYRESIISRRQESAAPKPGAISSGGGRSTGAWYRWFASAGLLAFFAVVTLLISERPSLVNFFCFILPTGALTGFLLREVWRQEGDRSGNRFRHLLRMIFPFLAGVAAPITVFLSWFASQGALRAWYEGAFVLATRRMQWAVMSPKLSELMPGLLPVEIALIACCTPRRFRRIAIGVAAVALVAIFIHCGQSYTAFESVGQAPLLLVPLAAVVAAIWLAMKRGLGERARQRVFLLAGVAATCSLVEYPYTAPVYFCYIAPLAALALAALLTSQNRLRRFSLGMLAVFYLAFGGWLHAPGYFASLRLPPPPEKPATMSRLTLARAGGLRIEAKEAAEYEALIATVRAHAAGPYIYAGVDCPEVYFLSGERNPTGTIWDFLDADFFSAGRTARVLGAISDHGVKEVVLHNDPYFSGLVTADLRAALDGRFPNAERVGDFEVRWK
jgi:4-amino-4-deoxy-L-arabinose transferase-like glycosyltransferase